MIAPNARIFAIKKVSLRGLARDIRQGFFAEVELLNQFRAQQHVVQLIDWEENVMQDVLYIVLEHGETDLSKLLERKRRQWNDRDPFEHDGQFIGAVWRDMLRAVRVRPPSPRPMLQ